MADGGLSRTAEKLIILLDYSNGLLTRLHGVVKFQRGPVFKSLTQKVVEHLAQKKEDPTVNVSKQTGSEVITQQAEAIENETRFCYETIADILMLTKEVMDVSTETTGNFDYPKAKAGGLNAPFMSIYIPSRYQVDGGAIRYLRAHLQAPTILI